MMYALAMIFPVAMVIAAATDIGSMTIPNGLVALLAFAFPIYAFAASMPPGILSLHLAAGIALLLVTFACFAAGWMGGGDAKLIAATALWIGPNPELVSYLLFASIAGGVLTIALLLARAAISPTTGVSSLDRLLRPDTGVPYGVALGAAGLYVFPSIAPALFA